MAIRRVDSSLGFEGEALQLSEYTSEWGFGVLGAGGQATELAGYAPSPIDFYAVDREYFVAGRHCVPIDDPGHAALQAEVVLAIGAPGAKIEAYRKWPGSRFATVIAASAVVAVTARVGEGTVVAPGASIMAGSRIGRHVLVNTGAIISHDCSIGDFSTVSPGATVGGRVQIDEGVFVGIGAVVRDGVSISAGAVIGAGAVVMGDVGAGEVVAGVPARLLRTSSEWLRSI